MRNDLKISPTPQRFQGLVGASLTCLLAGSARAASTVEDLSAGFGGGGTAGGDPPIDGRWLAGGVMVLAAGIALALVAVKLRRWHRARAASVVGVGKDLRRHLRLTRRQHRCLRLAAEELRLASPATLLLCPSLLRGVRPRLPREFGTDADRILRRLAA